MPLWGVKKFSWDYILACRYTFITSCIFFKYLYILCLVSKPAEGSNFLCAMENENIFPVDILRKIAVFLAHFSISYHQIWSTFCVWTKKNILFFFFGRSSQMQTHKMTCKYIHHQKFALDFFFLSFCINYLHIFNMIFLKKIVPKIIQRSLNVSFWYCFSYFVPKHFFNRQY